ncbi:hypothetical protein BH23GEM7_BH23GEM7_19340 [soil metagenome]|jgi:putative hydrolase of the HAD superfamily
MVRAVIFDLDNCLSPAEAVDRELYEPAFEAIRGANHGAVPDDVLQRALSAMWRHPLDWVAESYGFSPAMLSAGWAAFVEMEAAAPMHGYADLPVLASLPVLRFLVTSGFRRLQESKIQALGVEDLFTRIYIDALDEPGRKGKQALFEEIVRTHGLSADEVLVVGDSSHAEIEAGNRLGLPTVQILRPGVPRGTNATHYIESLGELPDLLGRMQRTGRTRR